MSASVQDPHVLLVRRFYANAITTSEAVDQVLHLVKENLGLHPHELMHADSICCDDVNAIQYPPKAREMLGPFNLGGLNGFPFAGLTGMSAFAHHVPEQGAVFIFYGPHTGIDAAGTLGQIRRIGQQVPSACCGAARAALQRLQQGLLQPGHITELDYQMNQIEQIFLRDEQRLMQADTAVYQATELMYEAIDKRMEQLVAGTDFPCRYVLLAGGILINSDAELPSYCAFRKLWVIDTESRQTSSWMLQLQLPATA